MRPLPRRTVLRGLGAAVALPLLEAMLPARPRPRPVPRPPLRLAYVYVPNGVILEDWTPAALGAGWEPTPTLAPLAPFRDDVLVISGLTHDKGRANGDGPGDHARACASFLTGAQPRKTAGKDLEVGTSADQLAAAAIGHRTRLRSLELGCEDGRSAGDCDSGYACAYSNSLSWSTPHTPLGKETDPRLVFERLFLQRRPGEDAAAWERRMARRRSVLDLVGEDAARLAGRLGSTDRRKLDEYLAAVREVERRIERLTSEEVGVAPAPGAPLDPAALSPATHGERMRVMLDLLVLAFRADLTRIATLMLANEGSNRSFPEIGVAEGHHSLSHHGGDAEKVEKLRRIDRFHVEQLAHLLAALAAAEEPTAAGERLLDHCLLVYGSGLGDGNSHRHDELPILLCGRGGGTLAPGRHLRVPRETPANDLHLALLERLGVRPASLGDGRGPLAGLDG